MFVKLEVEKVRKVAREYVSRKVIPVLWAEGDEVCTEEEKVQAEKAALTVLLDFMQEEYDEPMMKDVREFLAKDAPQVKCEANTVEIFHAFAEEVEAQIATPELLSSLLEGAPEEVTEDLVRAKVVETVVSPISNILVHTLFPGTVAAETLFRVRALEVSEGREPKEESTRILLRAFAYCGYKMQTLMMLLQ